MKISSLQSARYEYAPKLPAMLRNGIADICVNEGAETQSVADQEKIKALFPNTYGKKEITFQKGQNTSEAKKQIVGVILSGGQAPGGHNVICGLYDALKATNPENELYGFKGGPSGLIEDDYLIFDVVGSGNGVGLSQNGANELAKQGKSYDEILNYYYNEIEIKKYKEIGEK